MSRGILRTLIAAGPVWSVLPTPGHAQASAGGQRWEVHVDSGRVTVGDPVTIHFRVVLDERDLLFDTLPRPVDTLLEGVRILSVDTLRRLANRDFVGSARLAFYRTGPQPVPVFGLPFMRAVKGISRGMLVSDTVSVDVTPTLPAGNPALRDIREMAPSPVPWLAGAIVLAGVLLAIVARVRRRRVAAAAVTAAVHTTPEVVSIEPDPYEIAVARLDEIERSRWSGREHVALYYDSITGVLRDYLEAAESVPARERTTAELFWSLPPDLLHGDLRDRYTALFEDADLVKFARRRPGAPEAATFLDDARTLLARWRAGARARGDTVDALR